MRHHILLPTDFSENAWSAAVYAIKLYAKKSCTFYFSHAWTFVNTGSRTYISPSYIDKLKNTAKEQLIELTENAKILSTNTEHKFETIFSEEFLTESIKAAINKHAIDMVVMGTKGATGAKEFLLGSNSVTVIKKVKLCPILLIPRNYEFVMPERIAFANGFKRSYGDELHAITKLSQLHDSNIEIVHINKEADLTELQHSNVKSLKEFLKDHPHTFNWIPEQGRKEQILSNFIEDKDIQLLTMINYERSFLEDLINEPIIKKLGYHSVIPFMVIPHQA